MRSQCVITSIVDEFYPMITLKQSQVSRNQNLLDVSLPRIILLTKHVSFRVANFRGLTASFACLPKLSRVFIAGIMYNQYTRSFTQGGIYPFFLVPEQVFMLREQWNFAELCSTILSPLINHQGWCLMAPCTYTHEYDVSMRMQCIMPLHINSMSHM